MKKTPPLSSSPQETLRAAVVLKDAAVAASILKYASHLLDADLGGGISFTLMSARTGFVEGLKLAQELGVDLAAPVTSPFSGLERTTLLNHAVVTSSLETIRYLVEQGVSTSDPGLGGHSPLICAWERIAFGPGNPADWFKSQCANFEYLLDAGAPWKSSSPLHGHPVPAIACSGIMDRARENWRLRVLQKGVQAGWDLNAELDLRKSLKVFEDMPGPATALGIGLWLDQKAFVLELIRMGANTNNAIGQKSLLDLLQMKNAPFSIWARRDWLPEVTEAIVRRSIPSASVPSSHIDRHRPCLL